MSATAIRYRIEQLSAALGYLGPPTIGQLLDRLASDCTDSEYELARVLLDLSEQWEDQYAACHESPWFCPGCGRAECFGVTSWCWNLNGCGNVKLRTEVIH